MEWILTKDKLPDKGIQLILKTYSDNDPEYFVGELKFNNDNKRNMFLFEDYCCEVDFIEAWMIIPKFEKKSFMWKAPQTISEKDTTPIKEPSYMQKRALVKIKNFWNDHEYGPTNRELRDELGIKSTSSMYELLKELEAEDYVKNTEISRAVKLTKKGLEAMGITN